MRQPFCRFLLYDSDFPAGNLNLFGIIYRSKARIAFAKSSFLLSPLPPTGGEKKRLATSIFGRKAWICSIGAGQVGSIDPGMQIFPGSEAAAPGQGGPWRPPRLPVFFSVAFKTAPE
jgi:hypothetical protein